MKVCSIEGCEKQARGRGWCPKHYKRWQTYGDPLGKAPRITNCTIEGCEKRHLARGWCSTHYNRWQVHGDPMTILIREKIDRKGNCAVDGCDRDIQNLGYCVTHYQRWRRHGHPQAATEILPKHPTLGSCSIDGCDRPPAGRGWCSKHWTRWRNHGDPLAFVTNSKPSDWQRFWSKVQRGNPDDCWLWTGRLNNSGYGQFGPNFGSPISSHRYAYAEFVGPITPDRPFIDHRCRVRSCVNPSHLRAVTPAENCQNRSTRIDSTSGFRGVHFDAKRQMWFGRAKKGARHYSTPRFKTITEAHEAVSELRRQIFTHSEEDWQQQPGTGVQVQTQKESELTQ